MPDDTSGDSASKSPDDSADDSKVTPFRRPRKCPICRKPVAAEHKPFCSARCADVDLNRWLGEAYAVPGDPVHIPDDDPEA